MNVICFKNEVCLEDVWDGDEVSGGVKHHASVGEVWRVLNLREKGIRDCVRYSRHSQPGLLLQGETRSTRDPRLQFETEFPLRAWSRVKNNEKAKRYLAPK